MIKVLIIDDEPLQRQGIVRLTPWTDFDAEVVGDTGSGMEGILLARAPAGYRHCGHQNAGAFGA